MFCQRNSVVVVAAAVDFVAFVVVVIVVVVGVVVVVAVVVSELTAVVVQVTISSNGSFLFGIMAICSLCPRTGRSKRVLCREKESLSTLDIRRPRVLSLADLPLCLTS